MALLAAPQCPPMRTTVILHPSQLYMQVHESCGHPTRARPRLRYRGLYAGTSFLTTDRLGTFRYGSELIDIVADATVAGRHGHLRLGRRGRRRPARCRSSRPGAYVGYLTSRETAPRIGRQSGGAMRADGWNRIPLIRMTNINLLPRPGMSFDDIVADTDDGLLLATNRSLVHRRPAPELPVRHRDGLGDQGRQGRPALQEPHLHGHHATSSGARATPSPTSAATRMFGTPNCGKGEPGQIGHVGHGAAARASATSRWGSVNGERRPWTGWPSGVACATPTRLGRREAEVLVDEPRSRADPLRQQRDPPERGRVEHGGQPPLRRRAARGRAPPPTAPTTRRSAGWRSRPAADRPAHAGGGRGHRTCRSRPRSPTCTAPPRVATAEATPEFRAGAAREP